MNSTAEKNLSEMFRLAEKFVTASKRVKKISTAVPRDELALRIKRSMAGKGITQRQVAVRMGRTLSVLNRKINGKAELSLAEAFLLAEILDTPFEDLYFKHPY